MGEGAEIGRGLLSHGGRRCTEWESRVTGQISKISSLYLVGCLVLGAQVDAFEFGV